MPTTVEVAKEAAQRESLVTRNWILGGAVGLLFLLAQGSLTWIIANAASEVKETGKQVSTLSTDFKVKAAQDEALRERVLRLEEARTDAAKVHKETDLRLNSLERRADVHDQWITANKGR